MINPSMHWRRLWFPWVRNTEYTKTMSYAIIRTALLLFYIYYVKVWQIYCSSLCVTHKLRYRTCCTTVKARFLQSSAIHTMYHLWSCHRVEMRRNSCWLCAQGSSFHWKTWSNWRQFRTYLDLYISKTRCASSRLTLGKTRNLIPIFSLMKLHRHVRSVLSCT